MMSLPENAKLWFAIKKHERNMKKLHKLEEQTFSQKEKCRASLQLVKEAKEVLDNNVKYDSNELICDWKKADY